MKGKGTVSGLGWLLSGLLLWAEPVVELAPYTVEAWHFDGLAVAQPAGVARWERADIELSAVGSVGELLERLAGVRFTGFTGTGMEGQVAMRGFGDNSGLRVLILVDGIPYNPPDMGGINWLGIDPGELELVEVLRGGQTVLYGNHAVSGVIKLRTRKPGEGIAGRLEVLGGSDGLRRFAGGYGGGGDTLGIRAGASWLEMDGYRENAQGEARSGYLAWSAGESGLGDWRGRLSYDETEQAFPGPLSLEEMRADPRQSTSSGNDLSASEILQATLQGEGTTGWGAWQLQTGFLQRDRGWSLGGTDADQEQQRWGLMPRLKKEWGHGFLMAGVDLSLDRVDFTEWYDSDRTVTLARADLERGTVGAYLFGVREWGEGWQVSGGLRGEAASTDNRYVRYKSEQLLPVLETNRGPVPNPFYRDPPEAAEAFDGTIRKDGWAAEASLLKKIGKQWSLWAGWDRVYRYPSLDEAAAFQGFPQRIPLNTGLEPETGNNLETGLKLQGDHWHAGFTAFYLLLEDEITYDADNRQNINIGRTERRGCEVELTWQAERYGFSLDGSWTVAKFRDTFDSRQLPLVPEWTGGMTAWMKPHESLRLQVHGQYQSSQWQGNDFAGRFRRISGYGLWDVSLRWEPLEGVSLTAVVRNVLDENHAVTAYSGGFYPGPGRQGSVAVKHTF